MMPGMDPRAIKNLMKQVKAKEIPADELIIKGKEGDYRIENPKITKMNVMGQEVLQVVGKLEKIKEENEDYKLVMGKTGCSEEEAKKALEMAKGDIAEAILKLGEK